MVLTLDSNQFTLLKPELFSPNAKGVFTDSPNYQNGFGLQKYVLNPTKKDFREGRYGPRLTLTRRNQGGQYSVTLKIEFSAPKLLFGNNFDEVTEGDFDAVILKLKDKLTQWGVMVFEPILRQVKVSAIHYSKNIILTNGYTSRLLLNDLAKVNITQRMDTGKTDFRNEGHALRYHTNTFELAFYDKVRDMQQAKTSEKRGIENDNLMQLDLFRQVVQPKQLEVLRMEARIGNRTKLKSLLKDLGLPVDVGFEALFCQSTAQKVLLHYFELFDTQAGLLALTKQPFAEFWESLLINHPDMKPNKKLQIYGLYTLLQHQGVRDIKRDLRVDSTQWKRLKDDLEKLAATSKSSYNGLSEIGKALKAFAPVKLCDTALI